MKPPHLQPEYGAQFQDRSIAKAYYARFPYPDELFDIFETLHPSDQRRILELGAGTGDVTLRLLNRADTIEAIEPSGSMLAVARSRPGSMDPRLRWIEASAEDAAFGGPYSMAVAAESLHWMDWNVVIPKLAPVLEPGAFLVLVERDLLHPPPWDAELHTLIPAYSTNQEFRPYDLVGEVTTRRLFREAGRRTTSAVPFAQSIDDHVEAMHSRNGFSRERMTAESAAEFDACYRSLLQRHYPDGVVQLATVARVIWGTPVAPTSAA